MEQNVLMKNKRKLTLVLTLAGAVSFSSCNTFEEAVLTAKRWVGMENFLVEKLPPGKYRITKIQCKGAVPKEGLYAQLNEPTTTQIMEFTALSSVSLSYSFPGCEITSNLKVSGEGDGFFSVTFVSAFQCSNVNICGPFLISTFGMGCSDKISNTPISYKYVQKTKDPMTYTLSLLGGQSRCSSVGGGDPFSMEAELLKGK